MNPVSPEEMRLWAGYIKAVCGNNLDSSKGYLIESRLASLAQETGSMTWSELYMKVRADTSGGLRRRVISAVTINETSFFRDSAPYELLRHKIIPDVIDRKNKTAAKGAPIPLRVWSAACATGQEVYSVAIVLVELLKDLNRYDPRILGTDISDQAIAVASLGKYSSFDIQRGMAQNGVERFFIRDGTTFRIRDEVRALATFRTMNLLEPFTFPGTFDIILCRNVAIYFTENDRKRLFDRIGTVLAPDGCLIIGATELIGGVCPQFESKRYLKAVYYTQRRS